MLYSFAVMGPWKVNIRGKPQRTLKEILLIGLSRDVLAFILIGTVVVRTYLIWCRGAMPIVLWDSF